MSTPALLGEAAGRHDEAAWSRHAIELIQNDQRRSADTHLLKLYLPAFEGIDIYLKDESTHPTGSLKHRLARSLFLYGICNGRIRHDTPIVEASSGSTAISEAYFARMLGLPFHAVMSASTSQEKVQEIERQGGECHLVADGKGIYAAAEELADKLGGVYMDQFTYAERATDWRGNNNIAESIFEQMSREEHPVPAWIVMSAGTGGTTATLGRYIRYRRLATRLCVADPEHSAFFEAFCTGNMAATCDARLAHRGHRPAARRAVVHPQGDRPHDARARRGVAGRHARAVAPARPPRRRLDRHQFLRPVHAGLTHEGGRRDGLAGDADLRLGRTLRPHLLQRRLDRRAGLQPRAAGAGASTPSWTARRTSLGS